MDPPKENPVINLKAELRIPSDITIDQVLECYEHLGIHVDNDLTYGFSVLLEPNDSQASVYNTGHGNSTFWVHRTIFDGNPVHEQIDGQYQSPSGITLITLDTQPGSGMLNCSVFLNHRLISSRTSAFDEPAQLSDQFLLDFVSNQEGNASRLDKAVATNNSPYGFVLKMLQDYANSKVDAVKTREMFKKLSSNQRVVWNR